ncbi:MAG TPA: formimidoylglutamate deiminase, partial [Rhodanobacteraceae bacterium]
ETLWAGALRGGRQAAGMREASARDVIVLDDASPLLAARDEESVLDTFLFAGNTPLVRDVMAGGEWVVRDFRHKEEGRIAGDYRAAVEALAAG